MLVSTFGSRARAQDVPSTELRRVLVHPERRTEIVSPERIHGYTLIGSQRIVVFPGETVLDIQPVADFVPPMTTVLQVFGERHEWTVILQAVSQPDLVRKKVKLVVASAARAAEPETDAAAPRMQPSVDESDEETWVLSVLGVLAGGRVWLQPEPGLRHQEHSYSMVGVRLGVNRRFSPWSAETSLAIKWLDGPLEYTDPEGMSHDNVIAAWGRCTFGMRARKEHGPLRLSGILGAGINLRHFGELLMDGQKSRHGVRAGVFAFTGLGVERQLESATIGFDIGGELGTLDRFGAFTLTLYIGGSI
ncbi:hypothetical protein [Haliangium ochraceum]|uniref:hypothetical protein n=1 Tax=Haliangium ochraceum TaxID=80816 RepID=UPI001E35768B|nr:hypothetical protein [Haliangium ochraceum]